VKCLIVVAHPLQESFVSTLARAATDAAKLGGHEVRVQNLYADSFAPALTAGERLSYYSGFDASAISTEVENLRWAEALIIVFPTWWFGFPAMLKGWFDRVWGPEIAFDHAVNMGAIRPRLEGLKRTLAITTVGSPWWVDWLVMRRPVRRVLKSAILGTCAPACRMDFISFYKTEKLSNESVASAISKVKLAVARL
jgi:NAD(P)H dehydrogenase (quinone)